MCYWHWKVGTRHAATRHKVCRVLPTRAVLREPEVLPVLASQLPRSLVFGLHSSVGAEKKEEKGGS